MNVIISFLFSLLLISSLITGRASIRAGVIYSIDTNPGMYTGIVFILFTAFICFSLSVYAGFSYLIEEQKLKLNTIEKKERRARDILISEYFHNDIISYNTPELSVYLLKIEYGIKLKTSNKNGHEKHHKFNDIYSALDFMKTNTSLSFLNFLENNKLITQAES